MIHMVQRFRTPTLLIWGAEDEITPLWSNIPAGHLCYADQPEGFNIIVREFSREDHSS